MSYQNIVGRILDNVISEINKQENLFIRGYYAPDDVLDPLIKSFIQVVVIIGPLTIAGVIFFLKRIEKKNPDD